MKAKSNTNSIPSNPIIRITLVTVFILLIPLVAMQISNEVNWSINDFIVAGILLFGTGTLLNLIVIKVHTSSHRILLMMVLFTAFLYLWVELAVGIFTNWGS